MRYSGQEVPLAGGNSQVNSTLAGLLGFQPGAVPGSISIFGIHAIDAVETIQGQHAQGVEEDIALMALGGVVKREAVLQDLQRDLSPI